MKLIDYVETVEVPTDSASKLRFYFGEQPTLRDKRIINIYTYLVANVSKAPSGKALANDAVINRSFLVLVSKNSEVINRLPLYQLTGKVYYTRPLVIDRTVEWPKSYIELSAKDATATETFLFNFYCADKVPKRIPSGSGLNVEIVEVKTTPATIQKFMLPDHENLRGKTIHSIEYINSLVGAGPSGSTVVNATSKIKSYLTMISGGNDIIRKLPIYDLDPSNYNGLRFPFSFNPDLPKCYVECVDTANLVADQVYIFYFYYWDKVIRR